MKIQLERTESTVYVNGTHCRVWLGTAEDGSRITAHISLLKGPGGQLDVLEASDDPELSHAQGVGLAAFRPVLQQLAERAHCAQVALFVLAATDEDGATTITHACQDTGQAGDFVEQLDAQLLRMMNGELLEQLAGGGAVQTVNVTAGRAPGSADETPTPAP